MYKLVSLHSAQQDSGIYFFPDKWSIVTEWVPIEWSLLNVDLCLYEDGREKQLTQVKRGVLQDFFA